MLTGHHHHQPRFGCRRLFEPTTIIIVFGFLLLKNASAFLSITDPVVGKRLLSKGHHAATKNFVNHQHQTLASKLQLAANVEESDTTANDEDDAIAPQVDSIEIASKLLEEAIYRNSTAAIELLNIANGLRTTTSGNNNNNAAVEDFYNDILATGPDKKRLSSFLFKFTPLFFTRYSKRARLASLRRTISKTTSPTSTSTSASASATSSFSDSRNAGRRRAFVSLLRDIAKYDNTDEDNKAPSIIATLEYKARRMSNTKITTVEDLKSRIPDGLETPNYKVISSNKEDGGFKLKGNSNNIEIRQYLPYSVCAVSMNNQARPYEQYSKTDAKIQMPQMSGASSFGQLAGYLFGKNDKSTAMKMTTPVFTTTTKAEKEQDGNVVGNKQMEFVLPSEYWDTKKLNMDAPKPLPGSGVTLQQKETEYRAVLMFSGFATTKEVRKRSKELISKIEKSVDIEPNKNNWEIASASSSSSVGEDGDNDIAIAQHNDPFTVPWRRLNEVSIKLTRKN